MFRDDNGGSSYSRTLFFEIRIWLSKKKKTTTTTNAAPKRRWLALEGKEWDENSGSLVKVTAVPICLYPVNLEMTCAVAIHGIIEI